MEADAFCILDDDYLITWIKERCIHELQKCSVLNVFSRALRSDPHGSTLVFIHPFHDEALPCPGVCVTAGIQCLVVRCRWAEMFCAGRLLSSPRQGRDSKTLFAGQQGVSFNLSFPPRGSWRCTGPRGWRGGQITTNHPLRANDMRGPCHGRRS